MSIMQQETESTTIWSEVEPPAGLYALVLSRIALARRHAARIRALLLGTFALSFGAALFPILHYAASQLYSSGFYEYASLLFSDSGFAFSSSREILLSLVESLPSLAILLIIATGAGLLWSLYRMIPNAKIAFTHRIQSAY